MYNYGLIGSMGIIDTVILRTWIMQGTVARYKTGFYKGILTCSYEITSTSPLFRSRLSITLQGGQSHMWENFCS